jgi:hypothetical protein
MLNGSLISKLIVIRVKSMFMVFLRVRERMANMLNCYLGTLRMKYLNIILTSGHELCIAAFVGIQSKMIKWLDPWKGNNITSEGKLILTYSWLTSLPIFGLGFYLLPIGAHSKMDSIMAKFLWRVENKFRPNGSMWASQRIEV